VRVVLSGHSDPASATRIASIAHQFFEKPVRAADLIAALRDIEAWLRPSPPAPLREVLGAIGHLPAAPAAFVELSAAMDDPRVRVDDLIVVVKRDPALVAKVLQLASSTFFTRGLPARDLRTAIGRLGVRLVAALALAGSAFNVDRSSGVTLEQLTTHAVEAATAALGFAAPRHAEDAFVAALLADIGLSALACWMPSRVSDARTHAARNHVAFHQAEEALYGSTHAELGAYLLGLWRLPPPVVEAVALHHAADRSTLSDLPIALAVYDAHAAPGPLD
jgi:HD-like signal output (HDOD) protein